MHNPTFTNRGSAALKNVNTRYNDSIQCQTVIKVNNADLDLDTMVHVVAVDASLASEQRGDSIINSNISTLKRGLEETSSPPETPKKSKRAKKTAQTTAKTISSSSESVDEKRRVGCPYFKKDGTLKQPSCNGKGWPDPGKMKDHLKSVHKMEHKWLNEHIHFKEKPYFGEPIDVQWKLAFQKLFPEVPKDEIPSPYIDDISPPLRSAVPKKDTDALIKIIRQRLLDEFRVEELCDLPISVFNLGATFDKVCPEAIQDWQQYAPASSTESFDFVLPDTWAQEGDHDQSTPESNLSSLVVQTLTSMDLPMSPQVKTESFPDLSPSLSRYPTPEHDDDDVKPVIEAIAKEQLIQPLKQVAKVERPATVSLNQGYAFTTMHPFTQPDIPPFGQEYPFSDTWAPNCTPHSEQSECGLPNLTNSTPVEDPFMGSHSLVCENNAFTSGYNMSIMCTPFTNSIDSNKTNRIDQGLDLITESSGGQFWDEVWETTCQEIDRLAEKWGD